MMIKCFIGSVFAALLVLSSGLAQAQYDYEPIDYPSASFTQVFGVNDRGDAVGTGSADPDSYPFVYSSRKDTYQDIAPLEDYNNTALLGITDAGVIVGQVVSPDGAIRHGFIRDKKGNFTVVSHPDAFSVTRFRSINNKGLVTGFRDDSNDDWFGFIYDPKSNNFTDLNPTSFRTIVHGINSKGEVVGSSNFSFEDDPCPDLTNPFLRYGWLRATDGTVTYFAVNGTHTSARGINDEGSIAGFFYDLDDGKYKGFKADLDGSPCQSLTVTGDDVLEFPGAEGTYPEGITNSGAIIGIYDDLTTSHGFIAKPQ